MDIRAALEQEHNKAHSQRIADHIGNDPEHFAALMRCMLDDTPRIVQRASWPMGLACQAHPELATPWMGRMLDALDRPMHEAVHRNIVRTLQVCAFPKKFHGRLTEVLFSRIPDPARAIAVRAFAITAALRLVELYPELAEEFHLILEEALRVDPGPAIRSRAKKAFAVLRRMRPGDRP